MTKFSLIMPAYNAEKYICAAIDSAVSQTYSNWELIIVDDGSTDRTPEIIDEYAKKDARIVVVHQSNSGTASAVRNKALQYVTGDYVQMLDADDLISGGLLSAFADKLQEADYDIIIPNCVCFENDDIHSVYWKKKAPAGDYTQVLNGEQAFSLSLDWTIHGIFLIKNRILQEIRYDPELINGDEFTTRKLLYNSGKIGFADAYYYYRKNEMSTTKNRKNRIRMFETLLTDVNIYHYACSNRMSSEIIHMCSNKLIFSFCSYSEQYYHINHEKGIERAEQILSDTFSAITADMWGQAPVKYRIVYRLSCGKYDMFMKEMKLISRIRNPRSLNQ